MAKWDGGEGGCFCLTHFEVLRTEIVTTAQIIQLSKTSGVLWRNIVCFICNKNIQPLWATPSQDKGWCLRLLRCAYVTKILTTLFILHIAPGHQPQQYIFLSNKLHIGRTFESAQEEACWFQLAGCCFTRWVLELVIPRMKRGWGALFCSSHCAISLYGSFVPSKHWLPHSESRFSLRGVADIPQSVRTIWNTCKTRSKMGLRRGCDIIDI